MQNQQRHQCGILVAANNTHDELLLSNYLCSIRLEEDSKHYGGVYVYIAVHC